MADDYQTQFEFLNENLTLSIRPIPIPFTIFGSKQLSQDFHFWNISLDIKQGEWFAFGIIEIMNAPINPKV